MLLIGGTGRLTGRCRRPPLSRCRRRRRSTTTTWWRDPAWDEWRAITCSSTHRTRRTRSSSTAPIRRPSPTSRLPRCAPGADRRSTASRLRGPVRHPRPRRRALPQRPARYIRFGVPDPGHHRRRHRRDAPGLPAGPGRLIARGEVVDSVRPGCVGVRDREGSAEAIGQARQGPADAGPIGWSRWRHALASDFRSASGCSGAANALLFGVTKAWTNPAIDSSASRTAAR